VDVTPEPTITFAPPPAAPAPSTAPEPPRWTDADRKRFCAPLTEWDLRYEDVAAWCESVGRPRPSAMTEAQRKTVLDFLRTKAGAGKFDAWLAKATGGLAGSATEQPLAAPETPHPVGDGLDVANAAPGGNACVCPGCGAEVGADIAADVLRLGTCPACGQ
jgi:hypothetical protein